MCYVSDRRRALGRSTSDQDTEGQTELGSFLWSVTVFKLKPLKTSDGRSGNSLGWPSPQATLLCSTEGRVKDRIEGGSPGYSSPLFLMPFVFLGAQ